MTNIRNIVSSVSPVIKHLTSKKTLRNTRWRKGKHSGLFIFFFFSLFLIKKVHSKWTKLFSIYLYIYTHMYKTVNSILTFEAMPNTHSLMSSRSQKKIKDKKNHLFNTMWVDKGLGLIKAISHVKVKQIFIGFYIVLLISVLWHSNSLPITVLAFNCRLKATNIRWMIAVYVVESAKA